MLFITQDGHIVTSDGLDYIKAGRVYKALSFTGGGGASKLDTPSGMDAVDIYRTKSSVSWTKPDNTEQFVLQRATNLTFTSGLVTLYTGADQFYDDTTLAENTTYYYRVKAIATSWIDSDWQIISFKTPFTPFAWSSDTSVNPPGRSGNRFANATDVAFYGGNVNVGDYIVVGWTTGGNGGDWGSGCYINSVAEGAFASSTNKVVFIGNRGYDWIFIDMTAWAGTSGQHRIVTNSGGQVISNNFDLFSPSYVTFTGKYDAVAKTGDPGFMGMFAPNWNKLGRSFGFYFKGRYDDTTHFGLHVSGKCNDTIIEGCEGGEGNYVAVSIKNDGFALRKVAQPGVDQNFSIPNTGAGVFTTLTITDAHFEVDFDQIRIYAISGDTKVNWLEFEHQTTHVITKIEAESYNGNLRTSTEPTGDVGGGLQLTGATAGNSADYNVALPKGDYTVRARVSSSVSGGVLQVRTGSTPFYNLEMRYCFFHDTWGGENKYIGSTQLDPQQLFYGAKLHHIIYLRAGLNGLQTGQLAGADNEIHNCIMWFCGMSWTNAFALFQDQSTQQSSRQNGFKFYNNMVAGGGTMISYFMIQKEPLVSVDPTEFYNNALLNSLNVEAVYINTKDPYGGTVRFNNNVIGRIGTLMRYKTVYPWVTAPINHAVTFESSHDPSVSEAPGVCTLECNDNIYDFSIGAGTFAAKQGNMATLTIVDGGNNVRQATVPFPQFSNVMDLPNTYNWETFEHWTGRLCPNWDGFFSGPGTHAEQAFSADTFTIPSSHPTTITLNMIMNTPRQSGVGPHPDYYQGQGVLIKGDNNNYFWAIVKTWSRSNDIIGTLVVDSNNNVGGGTFFSWTVYGARVYDLDQFIFYKSRYYKSKIPVNIGHVPAHAGDNFWKLIVFSNGSLRPIDDFRLAATDYYHLRGMGTGFTV